MKVNTECECKIVIMCCTLFTSSHVRNTFSQQSSKTAQRLPSKGGTDGPFSNHCRTFDNQLKELSQQLMAVKERLGELQRDVSVLKRANTPPLGSRYDHVARDCRLLEQQLEHHQIELERLRNVFDALWEEQVCRIHIEKEIFHSQVCFSRQVLVTFLFFYLYNFFVDERYIIIEKRSEEIASARSAPGALCKIVFHGHRRRRSESGRSGRRRQSASAGSAGSSGASTDAGTATPASSSTDQGTSSSS